MDIEEIRRRLEYIEFEADHEEAQHGGEDALLLDFARHVAEHGSEPDRSLAALVITVANIDFPRWRA